MGANMYAVNKKTTFTYDHSVITYNKGTILDIPAGSAPLAAIAVPAAPGPESGTEHMGGGQY